MKKLIITKPGVINSSKYKELKEAGYIVLAVKDPNDIRVIENYGELNRDILLQSALEALNWGNDSTARNAFGNIIRKKIEEQIKNKS